MRNIEAITPGELLKEEFLEEGGETFTYIPCLNARDDHLDLIAESIAANGGRSCINASCIITPRHGRELAEALAERLAQIEPTAIDDPEERNRQFQEMVDRMYQVGKAVNIASHFEIDEVIDPADSRKWIRTILTKPAVRSEKKRRIDTW